MIRALSGPSLAAFLALAALAGAPSARADILYDTGVHPANYFDVQSSDLGFSVITGDDFTLGSAVVANQVLWTGIYNGPGQKGAPAADDFTIAFFDFSGASPAETPLFTFHVGNAVNRAATGTLFYGYTPFYSFRAALPDVTLAAGRYLISIHNNTPGSKGDPFSWTVGAGDGTFNRPTGGQWRDLSGISRWAADFTLLGSPAAAVPEPSSLVMLGVAGLGLLGLARARRG